MVGVGLERGDADGVPGRGVLVMLPQLDGGGGVPHSSRGQEQMEAEC